MAVSALYHAQQSSDRVSDEQLVERSRAGDMEAFGQIYARYERPVFRYAFFLLGREEDAADVKQETFLRAYHALRTYRAEARLLTWLLRICVNLCRDSRRSAESRNLSVGSAAEMDRLPLTGSGEGGDPYLAAERGEVVQTILKALDGLPGALREVLVLYEIEGLDYRQVAQALGCSLPAARVRVFRARQCLKERVHSMLGGV